MKTPSLQQLIGTTSKWDDDGLRASYNISLLIAKSGKPHTISEELILPAVSEVISTVLNETAIDISKRNQLSNNSVQRRINEMAQCVEHSLCDRNAFHEILFDKLCLENDEDYNCLQLLTEERRLSKSAC